MSTDATEVAELRAEVAALRAALEELRCELRREVRTERLAVVHPVDGRELVYTDSGSATLHVAWLQDDSERHSEVMIHADNGGMDRDGVADAGISVSICDELVIEIGAIATADEHKLQASADLMLMSGKWRRVTNESVSGPTYALVDADDGLRMINEGVR